MLERYLIEHCAPTLASMKSASLFSLALSDEGEAELTSWNSRLRGTGLSLVALGQRGDRALIYVCRMSHLQLDLQKPGVAKFLTGIGYQSVEVEYALERLKERLEESGGFPHEIGLFLGYPLGDVIGFIDNAGKNSKCSGCWKVYCNECEAIRMFARIQKCREIYARLWKQGKTVWQLTVAA